MTETELKNKAERNWKEINYGQKKSLKCNFVKGFKKGYKLAQKEILEKIDEIYEQLLKEEFSPEQLLSISHCYLKIKSSFDSPKTTGEQDG